MPGISRHVAAVLRNNLPFLRRLCPLSSHSYASTAAAEYDYDDYYYSEEEVEERSPARLATEKWTPGRGVQWVIMGDRGAKKHVFAEALSKLLEVPHISMGSLVRQELNPTSQLYNQIAKAVNERKLVPEEVIFALLSKRLEDGYNSGETGFILEGIPRTRIQAEILDQLADIDLVVNFKCSEVDVVKNKFGTGTDEQLISTDVRRVWKENLAVYAEQSKLLEEYYRKQQKLVNVPVASAPGETWQGLLAALHLQHMNTNDSSQKLTA